MQETIYSLIPPVIALLLVIFTRRVLLSLGVGIVIGALMVHQFAVLDSVRMVLKLVAEIFVVDGALNDWELYILLFLLLLGMTASTIAHSGGSQAFGTWALKKVKTRTGAQFVTILLGVLIFIDDYFNSLTVGKVSRPLTDRHRISRAKLAYLVDTTAAPICVISPLSSWGAYIITLIAGVLAAHSVTQYEALQAFIYMIPLNFYAIFALMLVVAVAFFKLDFGPMRKEEARALQTGQLYDPRHQHVPGEEKEEQQTGEGRIIDLVLPILSLVLVTVLMMLITGRNAVLAEGEQVTLLSVFEYTDVALSLLLGGTIGLIISLGLLLSKRVELKGVLKTLNAGIRSMLPAVLILIFAWTIGSVVSDLGTGTYLAYLIDGNIGDVWLPLLIFIIAGFMAFTTGTSWGTFALMLPISADIAMVVNTELLLPLLAAVLAGAIFGDHCSPISDTTILSSVGSGSPLMDHVITQLPYALITALIASIAYLALGITGHTWLALLIGLVCFGIAIVIIRRFTVQSASSTPE